MTIPILRLTNITKTFKTGKTKKIVLNSISFEIKEGQNVILHGKNGIGKSTIANILAGMIKPDEGEVYLFGENIKTSNSYKRHIGYMGQTTTFFPFLKTKEILYLFCRLKGMSKKEAIIKIDELMEYFKTLKDHSDTYFVDLSSGTKKLLSFCIATLNSPKLLVLDEPTESLDTYNRQRLWEMIGIFKKENNMTLLIISHNPQNEPIEPTKIIMLNEENIT